MNVMCRIEGTDFLWNPLRNRLKVKLEFGDADSPVQWLRASGGQFIWLNHITHSPCPSKWICISEYASSIAAVPQLRNAMQTSVQLISISMFFVSFVPEQIKYFTFRCVHIRMGRMFDKKIDRNFGALEIFVFCVARASVVCLAFGRGVCACVFVSFGLNRNWGSGKSFRGRQKSREKITISTNVVNGIVVSPMVLITSICTGTGTSHSTYDAGRWWDERKKNSKIKSFVHN